MNDLGNTYVGRRERELKILKKILSGDYKINYYNNFVVINDRAFNGYTPSMIDSIIASLPKRATPGQEN